METVSFNGYSEIIKEHFLNPRNVGEIPDADGVGSFGDPECGDYLRVWIKVRDEHIMDIKFRCKGCPAAIACASMMTVLASGKHVDEAAEMDEEMIDEALGGLPEHKRHCSNLGAGALQEAILDYVFRSAGSADHRSLL